MGYAIKLSNFPMMKPETEIQLRAILSVSRVTRIDKHMLPKEKMTSRITKIQRPALSWNTSFWVIWPCLLEIGSTPQKTRRGNNLFGIKVYALISCQYRLQIINARIRLKVTNQVWYIIIFLHMLSAKYLTAARVSVQKATWAHRKLDLKAKWEKKISYYVSVCYQKPRTSWKDVKDRGITEEREIVWLIPLAGHLHHQGNIYILNKSKLQRCSSDSILRDLANPIRVAFQQTTPNAAKRVY